MLKYELTGHDRIQRVVRAWSDQVQRELPKLFRQLGFKWHAEAVKRVPVDEGTLKEKILHTTYYESNVLTTDVGTNVQDQSTGFRYPQALEFGTRFIAARQVLAIGDKPEVRDTEAIHSWPAKDGEAIDGTSSSIDTAGGAAGRLRDAKGRFAAGPQEQMPWLRTSWTSGVKDWFLAKYQQIMNPKG